MFRTSVEVVTFGDTGARQQVDFVAPSPYRMANPSNEDSSFAWGALCVAAPIAAFGLFGKALVARRPTAAPARAQSPAMLLGLFRRKKTFPLGVMEVPVLSGRVSKIGSAKLANLIEILQMFANF